MNTKRKFTGGSVEARTPDSRSRLGPEHLQAQLPRVGLLWGVEGSAQRVLERASDAWGLLSVVNARERDREERGTAVENALAGVFEGCRDVLGREGYVPATPEEFFDRVTEEMAWTRGRGWAVAVSESVLMQVCLKLVAARRAYRCGGRKFYELDRAMGPLIPAIDRFDAALDPKVAAAWLDSFTVPAEAEEADDEMESPRWSAAQNRKAVQYRCMRRKTMDRQSMPHTPPRLLCPTNGSGVMGAPKGLRGGALAGARAQRQRHGQESLSSPSRQVESGGQYLGDMDAIMGGLDSMVLDEMPGYYTAPSFA